MWHKSHLAAQRGQGYLAHIDSIDEDVPPADIEQARQQADQGRFPTARWSHNCQRGTRFHTNIDIMQHFVIFIRERHVLELYLTLDVDWRLEVFNAIGNRRLMLHDFVDASHRGRALLEKIDYPAKGDHRPRELCQVAHELHELAKRNTSINDIETTAPQQDHRGKSRQEVHSRPQQRIEAGVADAEAHIFLVGGAKCL